MGSFIIQQLPHFGEDAAAASNDSQVFQHIDLWDFVRPAHLDTFNLSARQQFIAGFSADTPKHLTELGDVHHIRVFVKKEPIAHRSISVNFICATAVSLA